MVIVYLFQHLKLPNQSFGGSDDALMQALNQLLPNLLTWLLSFWEIAIYWLAQAGLNRRTKEFDLFLVRITFTELARISLLPFSTSLIGEHGSHVIAAVIYSSNLLGIAALSLVRTLHVLKYTYLHENQIAHDQARSLTVGVWFRLFCSAATLSLAFFFPGWNMLAMTPLFLLPYYLRHSHQRPE
jgi:uncharacterized membrane protein